MPKTTFKVEPSTENSSGWDVKCFSWNESKDRQIFHKIKWTRLDDDKTFEGETADLPAGVYGVRCAVIGLGTAVETSAKEEWKVVQPRQKEWPLVVKVDATVGTQHSETWYFETTGEGGNA